MELTNLAKYVTLVIILFIRVEVGYISCRLCGGTKMPVNPLISDPLFKQTGSERFRNSEKEFFFRRTGTFMDNDISSLDVVDYKLLIQDDR